MLMARCWSGDRGLDDAPDSLGMRHNRSLNMRVQLRDRSSNQLIVHSVFPDAYMSLVMANADISIALSCH